jgi:hypothetical protein
MFQAEVQSADEVAVEHTSALPQTNTNGSGADTRPADFVQFVNLTADDRQSPRSWVVRKSLTRL